MLAVESDPRACADAARNTADQPQVRIRTAEVDAALLRPAARPVARPGRARPAARRAGPRGRGRAGRRCARARVAYVSCEAASFARDARVLLDAGWTMPSLRAFDLYPMTEHVELLAVLEPPAA